MGNSFGFLHTQSNGGFQFTVLEACKAETVDLASACNLTFGPDKSLMAIGNVTRGKFTPQPGIAGIGIWIAMIPFFGVVVAALVFVIIETLSRSSTFKLGSFAWLKDSPPADPHNPSQKKRKRDAFRAAGRIFVLGAADTQIIFVGAFLLAFAGRNKCLLTSYHFSVAVNQMMVALSVLTLSVSLVRTYWRNPYAAALRLVLSLGAFIGVGLTIFRKANYAPDWPPPTTRKDSAILLPVACLLEGSLRNKAQEQAHEVQADLGFGSLDTWPADRIFFILLAVAFSSAHVSIPIRYAESQKISPNQWKTWKSWRPWLTFTYWTGQIVFPTFASIWSWAVVFRTRDWMKHSGWIANPNPEMIIWDTGQLIALGAFITVLINMLTEVKARERKDTQGAVDGFQRIGGDDTNIERRSILMVKPNMPHDWGRNYGYEPPSQTQRYSYGH